MYHEAAELVKKDVKTILLQCADPAAQDIDNTQWAHDVEINVRFWLNSGHYVI